MCRTCVFLVQIELNSVSAVKSNNFLFFFFVATVVSASEASETMVPIGKCNNVHGQCVKIIIIIVKKQMTRSYGLMI